MVQFLFYSAEFSKEQNLANFDAIIRQVPVDIRYHTQCEPGRSPSIFLRVDLNATNCQHCKPQED